MRMRRMRSVRRERGCVHTGRGCPNREFWDAGAELWNKGTKNPRQRFVHGASPLPKTPGFRRKSLQGPAVTLPRAVLLSGF